MSDRIIISGDVQLNNRISNNVKLSDSVAGNTGSFMPVYEDNYERLLNKPRINGVELVGNKTTEDLNIVAGVSSVNGKTGAVRLKASDVNALSDTTFIPTKVSELINDSEFATQSSVPTKLSQLENNTGFINAATARSVAPVQSVNGQTGMVVLSASEVGALPDSTTIPTKTSDLTNDSGFITSINSSDVTSALGYTPYNATNPSGYVNAIQAASAAPVQSVNGQTGDVVYTPPNYALTYDESVSVGSAVVGEAVTGEPNYTPSGTVTGSVTTSRETFMTGGGTMVNTHYANYKLYFDSVSFIPSKTTKDFVTGIGDFAFNGNGVTFVIEQEN